MSLTEQIEITEGLIQGTSWPSMKKVINSGITTVGDLARQTPQQLADQSGVGKDTCEKYINLALDMIDIGYITGDQLWDKMKGRRRLSTGSRAVDEILRSEEDLRHNRLGGIEESTTTEVSGKEGAGKTQLMHMFAVNAQLPYEQGGLDGNVVWLDTENTLRPDRIIQICRTRGYDMEKILKGITYIEAVHSLHQRSIIAKLPQLCHERNIRLIIVDSMMAHLRNEYPGRGLLAERQQLLADILQRLDKISRNHRLTVVYTNQVMDRPVAYGDPEKAVGGHVMGHAATLRLHIRQGRQGKRVMHVTKSPYLPEREAVFMITDAGIEDVEGYEPPEKPEDA